VEVTTPVEVMEVDMAADTTKVTPQVNKVDTTPDRKVVIPPGNKEGTAPGNKVVITLDNKLDNKRIRMDIVAEGIRTVDKEVDTRAVDNKVDIAKVVVSNPEGIAKVEMVVTPVEIAAILVEIVAILAEIAVTPVEIVATPVEILVTLEEIVVTPVATMEPATTALLEAMAEMAIKEDLMVETLVTWVATP